MSYANQTQRVKRGTVVVITGASAGVGRATARVFAGRGASIGLLARGHDGLSAARKEVEDAGSRALAVAVDVSDAEGIELAAARVEGELGPIDIWINNAMVSVFSPVKEMTAEEYRRVTEVTYLGYVHGTLSALKRMLPRNKGLIIQVGSALAYRSIPLQSAYCACKHAIVGFTDSLRCELLHDKSDVQVTMVHMPALNTPQFNWVKTRLPRSPQPVPPIFEPEVAAEAILFAAEHPRRESFVGLSTLAAVTAQKFIPGVLDRYLGQTGYDSQQTDRPVEIGRPNNLMKPLPGDFGAHGSFDSRATGESPEFWTSKHRKLAGLVAIGLAGATVATLSRLIS